MNPKANSLYRSGLIFRKSVFDHRLIIINNCLKARMIGIYIIQAGGYYLSMFKIGNFPLNFYLYFLFYLLYSRKPSSGILPNKHSIVLNWSSLFVLGIHIAIVNLNNV